MNAGPPPHPTADILQAYSVCKLDDATAEAVREHLTDCPDCQRQVTEMAALGSAAPAAPPVEATAADDGIVSSSSSPVMSSTGHVDATSDASGGADDLSLPSGTRVGYFGDYELLKVLGEGGMGIVYKARQLSLNRPVAVKMFKASRFPSAGEVRRFQNESEAVARLDHPNIVPVFEVGQYEDQHYFSMKLVAGESLDKRPKDYLSNPRRAAALVATIAGAVHHAHQRGILHRDLKPANILIDSEGQPHVTDFGLAKRVEGDSELTQSGAILGTPAYMAPEQASGKRGAVTTSTDVYGLGAILYALLTGRAPFGGTAVLDVLEQVRERTPDSPRTLNPQVPPDLEVICLKCLAKDPRHRYASADALAEDLKRWLAGEPIAARPVGSVARFWMWTRRNPVVAGAAGLVAVAVVAVAVLSLLYAREQNRRLSEQFDANRKIGGLNKNLEKEGQKLKSSLADSNRRLAMVHFERAQRAFDSGQVSYGLLWLVECWRFATNAGDSDWQYLARANLSFWRYHWPELKGVFPHHARGIRPVFSPDGKTILFKSKNDAAWLWDVASDRPLGVTMVHEANISCMMFSPDGKTVVTGSADKTARLWDALTGESIAQPLKHLGGINSVAFSPDGKTVVTGSADGMARFWNVATAEQIGKPMTHRGPVMSVAFSPDGETILTSSAKRAQQWDTAGRPIAKPMEHSTPQMRTSVVIYSPGGSVMEHPAPNLQSSVVSYSPDGKVVLTASHDEIRLWDSAPGGKTFVTGSTEKTAQLWSALTGKPIGQALKHEGEVSAVAFSPDGKTVLTGSHDNTARLWDAATTEPIGRPMTHQTSVVSTAFSPDGKTVLTVSTDNIARVWDANIAQAIGQALEHRGSVSSVMFSPNSELFLTLGARTDRAVRLWITRTGAPFGQAIDDPDTVSAAAFSTDGKMLVTVSYRNIGRFWDVATGKLVGQTMRLWSADTGETSGSATSGLQVRSVSFSPDNNTFVTESMSGTVRLWNATSGRLIVDQAHAISAVFSPDGKIIATGSAGTMIRLRDTASGQSIRSPLEHTKGGAWPMAFSPDGTIIVTGGEDKTIRMWNATTGRLIGQPLIHESVVTEVAFLGNEKLLTLSDQMTRLWSTATGETVGQPFVPSRGQSRVGFNPASKTILTKSNDERMRLWDIATGQPLSPALDHGGSIDSVAYSPDGKTIVAATLRPSAKTKVRMWHLPTLLDHDLTRIELWVEMITGLRVDDLGIIHSLDLEGWKTRRARLHQLGGPPKTDSGWLFLPPLPLRSGLGRAPRSLYELEPTSTR
jgi:eukaryotic-like serine/threonine-protein kinase